MAIVGRGRMGTALATALADCGYEVIGPLGRGADGRGPDGRGPDGPDGRGPDGPDGRAPDGPDGRAADAVLLCVPDGEIAHAAAQLAPGPLVGHCSGATDLEPLSPHEAFSLHPLMTVTAEGAEFAGAGAAIAGSTPRALAYAAALARALNLRPVEIADRDRPAYHVAASIASNFLITLEAAAERIATEVGLERDQLVPLVRATVENWARLGPERALTGPVARGDEATVARQRAAVAEVAEDLLPLFDTLVAATRAFARTRERPPAAPPPREAQPA